MDEDKNTDSFQMFCQCHESRRRYGIIHNWNNTQLAYLAEQDTLNISHLIARNAGADADAFTFMSALIVLALKEWDVSETCFLREI